MRRPSMDKEKLKNYQQIPPEKPTSMSSSSASSSASFM